jgi:hypothetical protein
LSLGLREPRGSVRFGWGGRFLRASRLSSFRSALSLMFFVFMRAYLSLVGRPNKTFTTEVPFILSEAKNPRSFGVAELQILRFAQNDSSLRSE